MSKKGRFTRGRRVDSVADLMSVLQSDIWVYWEDRPKHPSVLWHMQLGTLKDAVNRRILYVALEELP